MNSATTVHRGLDLSARSEGGITIAELAGELDIANAPALREQLLSFLRPGSRRLVIDLSKVSFCDATGLAVLVSTARRAGPLGGFLRLAAVSPQVAQVLEITGLHRHLANFPTVHAASTGARGAQYGKAPAPGRGPARRPLQRTGAGAGRGVARSLTAARCRR